MRRCKDEFKEFERQDVKYREDLSHLKQKIKKLNDKVDKVSKTESCFPEKYSKCMGIRITISVWLMYISCLFSWMLGFHKNYWPNKGLWGGSNSDSKTGGRYSQTTTTFGGWGKDLRGNSG